MVLTFAEIYLLISTCSVPLTHVTPQQVAAIIQIESARHVYALSGSYSQSHYSMLPGTPQDQIAARYVAADALTRDVNVSVGLMQVNTYHIKRMGVKADWFFDPCNNIHIGTSIIKDIETRRCNKAADQIDCLEAILREYNTGRPQASTKGDAYVRRFKDALAKNRERGL